jgi:uncharacterized protein YcfJ
MNKSFIPGLVAGGIAVTAVGAMAGYQVIHEHKAYAEVVSVEPLTKTVRTPRQSCRDETVTRQAPTKDPDQVTGTVVGALLGGVVGHQVGHGTGKTLATVAGAAAGGYAGNKVQESVQKSNTYQSKEQRCATAYDSTEQTVGYTVHYRIGDKDGTVRMDHDPGDRIPLDNGQLVLKPVAG